MQEARPFFLLDWLDDLMVNQDAFQIAELLKTPNKLPRGRNQLHAYSSEHQIAPQSSNSNMDLSMHMLRSMSSPQVSSSFGTPRSSNRRNRIPVKHDQPEHHHLFGILPTRLFDANSQATNKPSLPVAQQPFKKRSMALGNGWNAKGLTKAKQGKWEAALACWDNALEIRLQISDPNSRKDQLEVANTWNNRGIALGKLGQYHNAIEALQQAYQIRSTLLEKGHPQVVSTLHNIANVHQQQGDLTTALQVFGNAKSLLVQSASTTYSLLQHSTSPSKDHSNKNSDPMLLARICTAIGHIYYQAQQWIDSRDAYQDALNVLLNYPEQQQQQQQQPPHNKNNSNENQHYQQQREIYELQRDIQELNAKISVATFHSGPTNSFFHHHEHHHGHRTPPQQSPQH